MKTLPAERQALALLTELEELGTPAPRPPSHPVPVGPGVLRRRGALPRPPDPVQVVEDDSMFANSEQPLREQVLEEFRQARRRR